MCHLDNCFSLLFNQLQQILPPLSVPYIHSLEHSRCNSGPLTFFLVMGYFENLMKTTDSLSRKTHLSMKKLMENFREVFWTL